MNKTWQHAIEKHNHDGSKSQQIDYNNLLNKPAIPSQINIVDTGVYARITGTQTLSSGVLTRVIFSTEDKDNLSEYDNSTGTFTANGDGWRMISSIVSWASDDSTPAGVRILSIYLNSTRLDKGREILLYADTSISGWYTRQCISTSLYLSNGDTIEIYAYQSSGNSLAVQGSTFSITGGLVQ